MKPFSHVVEFDEESRKLTIYRLFADGKRHLFTSVDIPEAAQDGNSRIIDAFAHQLGENLLLDSPIARKLLNM